MPSARPHRSLSSYWNWPGHFPARAALVLPFAFLPAGILLMVPCALFPSRMKSLCFVGLLTSAAGLYAALPSALYVLFVWLMLRPASDRQLAGALLMAPPVCGAIAEVVVLNLDEIGNGRPSWFPANGYFFFASTFVGYAVVTVLLLVYLRRSRAPQPVFER